MLAFAKDITLKHLEHPEESKVPKLKEYMEYHRKLDSEKLVYHALDHAKTYLQKNIHDFGEDSEQTRDYVQKAFPSAAPVVPKPDTLLLMLRKLVNAHNSTNNWYRMNAYYYAVVYDALDRFLKIYNRLVREKPDKAREYGISDGVEIDFDDWVQLYFQDLDFLVGRPLPYVHYTFKKRNEAIQRRIEQAQAQGKTREEALQDVKQEFEMDPAVVNLLRGRAAGSKDLELFYTSRENPIYETIYEADSAEGFMDGESLADHSFFLGHQLKGLNEEEAESIMKEAMSSGKKM